MQFQVPIVILGPRHERIAVVEVRNQEGLSSADGANRTVYMRATGGLAAYFMLVSQDAVLLWKGDDEQPTIVPMAAVIRRYLPNLANGDRLYEFQVESIVSVWLSELAAGWRTGDQEPERTLEATGFLTAIRNAQVHAEAVA